MRAGGEDPTDEYPANLRRHFHFVHGRWVRGTVHPKPTDEGAQDGRVEERRRSSVRAGDLVAGAGSGNADWRQFCLLFDPEVKQYGPETQPLRDKLKAGIVKGYQTFWGGGDVDPKALKVETPLANAQALSDFLATLQPKTDAEKAALATANQYASMVIQSRLLMSLQVASGPVSWFLIAILVFWTAALFFGIGLYAAPNGLVYAALAFGGLSIAFAIFLIFEFGLPYTGLFRVPPAALEQAIEFMGK
jgi:hypothetical protein